MQNNKQKAGRKLLVADDDLELVKAVRRIFRRRRLEVLEASNGDEAMALILTEKPDVVILDVMMPGQSGWEICRNIRQHRSLEHTGVILLTGVGDRLNEMTSSLYGADGFLGKPFEPSELRSMVAKVLKARKANGEQRRTACGGM